MRKISVLVAKLVGFAILVVWILGLLATGIVLFNPYTGAITSYFGVSAGVLYSAFVAWYWATLIVVGTLVAVRAFRLVGKWEKPGIGS